MTKMKEEKIHSVNLQMIMKREETERKIQKSKWSDKLEKCPENVLKQTWALHAKGEEKQLIIQDEKVFR